MLPIDFEQRSWFKFSKYETFETNKGVYIIPTIDSEKIFYDPYSIKDKIILEYLNFGKLLYEGLDGKMKVYAALNLVKKYGLLGIYTFLQYRDDLYNSKYSDYFISQWYDDGEFVGEKSFQEFISDYFPLPNRQPPSIDKCNERIAINEENIFVFSKNYSERVGWVARVAYRLYENFKNIQDFKNVKEIENLTNIEYVDKVISCRSVIKNIDIVIQYDEVKGASLMWSVDNLYKMINIMYALQLIDKRNGLASCINCGTIYPKSRMNKEYCNGKCGNSYRVKRCKKKKESD